MEILACRVPGQNSAFTLAGGLFGLYTALTGEHLPGNCGQQLQTLQYRVSRHYTCCHLAGGLFGLYTALTGEHLPGGGGAVRAMAECNALGRGPVVFEMAQAGIAAIRRKAAGKVFFLQQHSLSSTARQAFCP